MVAAETKEKRKTKNTIEKNCGVTSERERDGES